MSAAAQNGAKTGPGARISHFYSTLFRFCDVFFARARSLGPSGALPGRIELVSDTLNYSVS